jgi:hypothetical protein
LNGDGDEDRPMADEERPDWFGAGDDDGVTGPGDDAVPDDVPDWFGEAEQMPVERPEPVGERSTRAENGEHDASEPASVAAPADVEMDGEVADGEAGDGATTDAVDAGEAEPEPAEPEPDTAEPEPADPEPADPEPDTTEPEPADPEPDTAEPDPEPTTGGDDGETGVSDVEMDGEVERDVPEPSAEAASADSTGTGGDSGEFEAVEDDDDSGGLVAWIKSIFGL